jgi:O-antigen/teichoic acid export membrane protein
VRGAVPDSTVTLAILAAIATFLLGLPVSIAPQIYAGYQKTYVANGFTLVGVAGGFVALLACVRASAPIPVLVAVFGLGTTLGSTLGLVNALRTMPWLRPRSGAWSGETAREILRRSVPLFLFQVGALTVNEAQVLVLAHRRDLATVADYSILWRLYIVVMGLVQVSTSSFVPAFREAAERGDRAWVRSAFGHFLRLRVALAFAAGLALVAGGNVALRLWLGRDDVAFGATTWASVAALMLGTTWVTAHADLLAIMDRLWLLVGLVAVNGAVTIVLTWALAPALGVLGVVLATSAVTLAVYSWLVPWIARVTVLPPRAP